MPHYANPAKEAQMNDFLHPKRERRDRPRPSWLWSAAALTMVAGFVTLANAFGAGIPGFIAVISALILVMWAVLPIAGMIAETRGRR